MLRFRHSGSLVFQENTDVIGVYSVFYTYIFGNRLPLHNVSKICCEFVKIWYNKGKLIFGNVFCKMISLVFLAIDL